MPIPLKFFYNHATNAEAIRLKSADIFFNNYSINASDKKEIFKNLYSSIVNFLLTHKYLTQFEQYLSAEEQKGFTRLPALMGAIIESWPEIGIRDYDEDIISICK